MLEIVNWAQTYGAWIYMVWFWFGAFLIAGDFEKPRPVYIIGIFILQIVFTIIALTKLFIM